MASLHQGGRLQANFSNRNREHHTYKLVTEFRFLFWFSLFFLLLLLFTHTPKLSPLN
jgi:hypothetical protein